MAMGRVYAGMSPQRSPNTRPGYAFRAMPQTAKATRVRGTLLAEFRAAGSARHRFDEFQEVDVDRGRVRCLHSVRESAVRFQRAIF